MKQIFILILVNLVICPAWAQLSLTTEYLGNSGYQPKKKENSAGKEGFALVYRGSLKLPIAKSKDSLPKIFGIDISGAVVNLENKNLSKDEVLSNIINLQISLFHFRPLKNNWSLLAFAGAGIYTGEKSLSDIKTNHILGNTGAIFIKKINPNLELGAGAAINNAFGYPMLFPAFYFNFSYEGRYTIKASVMNGLELLAGYTFSKNFSLYFSTEMNAQLALLKRNEKDVMFTHQYITVGLKPQLKIQNNITIPVTVGINATRFAYFNERNLKSIFNDSENNTQFGLSPYIGIALNFKI